MHLLFQYIEVSLLSHNNDFGKIKINERLTKSDVTSEDCANVFAAALGSFNLSVPDTCKVFQQEEIVFPDFISFYQEL